MTSFCFRLLFFVSIDAVIS